MRPFLRPLLNISVIVLLLATVGWQLSVRSSSLTTLKGKTVPLPDNLENFVRDNDVAVQLGKALFWDMQLGTDGVQTCASCHFTAGADNRIKNQMRPSGKDNADGTFSFGGPNYTLRGTDFPFAKGVNEITSSQGTYHSLFMGVDPGAGEDMVQPLEDEIFNVNGLNTRQVEPRNAPTIINAIFQFRLLWDGRANNQFNGRNPFGPRDEDARIWLDDGSSVWPERILLENAAMASVATGPPVDFLEAGSIGRSWPFIGKRLLPAKPLAKQQVDRHDSHLGALRHPDGGLNTTYQDLVRRAFRSKVQGDYIVRSEVFNGEVYEFTQTEDNFSFFAGISIMMYVSTQISDESPFDDYLEGDDHALTSKEKHGLDIFLNEGKCIDCHDGPDLTNAGFRLGNAAHRGNLVNTFRRRDGKTMLYDRGFFNTGVRATEDDFGMGRDDDFGNDLSFAEQYASGTYFDDFDVDSGYFDEPLTSSTKRVAVEGAFKTPGLRNVDLTGPYMHNGGFATLRQVVDLFDRGGDFGSENAKHMHRSMGPLHLSEYDKDALVAFMLTLTDERVRKHRAPFDHPQLFVPDGHTGNQSVVYDDGWGQAITEMIEIPAVGKDGYDSNPRVLALFHDRLGLSQYDGDTGGYNTADLSIKKRLFDHGGATVGDAVRVELTVKNHGPDDAENVYVTDDFPKAMTFALGSEDGSHGSVSVADGIMTWHVGELDDDETATLSFQTTIVYPYYGTISNTATAQHADAATDPDLSDNSFTAEFEALTPQRFPAGVQIQAGTFWRDTAGNVHPIVGTYNSGVYRGVPPGTMDLQMWVEASEGLPKPLIVNDAITTRDNQVIIAAWGYEGIYRSPDGGRTWHEMSFDDPTNLSGMIVYALEEAPDGTLYASADRGRIFRSLDGGNVWKLASELPGSSSDMTWSLVAHPTRPGTVFAGTFGNGVFVTYNYGLSWSTVGGNGFGADGRLQVFDLEFDPATHHHPVLWAATAVGVFRSSDFGDNWEELNEGFYPFKEARALAFHPDADGPVFAAIWGGGVYKLEDRSASTDWVLADMAGAQVTTVFYEPWNGSLAVGTDAGGFHLMEAGVATSTDAESIASTVPVAWELNQNYPNPFNPSTSIRFDVPEAGGVRLAVYDVLGRERALLVDGPMLPGAHEVRFDASNLPSGTYLYRLTTGQTSLTRTMVLAK